ncbi:hypothetical protein PVAP13_5KG702300 [Panicum virgatum]|uniref:rRNA N-glycosylase n=1 Tax=Panicum virgatum TaxID=38727 RepID=A0A8T0T008_PANVG|nr:hypothetical protein PVAP13_5KG702300 [Panicum virgatum]
MLASVTGSILKTIREDGTFFSGCHICPPNGQFHIVLYPGSDSGLCAEYQYGKVSLLFSYPNLYLEAFWSRGVWHRFKDTPAHVVPGGVSQRLPFECGYHNGGMQTDLATLRFGKSTIPEIYKVLGAYPDNPGGVGELQEALSKVCVVFPEAIRFPELRCFLVFVMKWINTEIVPQFSKRFHNWEP